MKGKHILSAGTIGIVLMMLGQLCFAINDTLVKDIVVESESNMSVINVIFLLQFYYSLKRVLQRQILRFQPLHYRIFQLQFFHYR